MRTLFERGIIRAIGVSNFSVDQMEQFRRVSPLHVVQAPYNLFEREIDADVLPYCLGNKIAVLGYGALCRGLLTGRIGPDAVFSDDDLRRVDPKFLPPRFVHYLSAVHKLDALAQRRLGKRVIHLAVRWMLDRGVAAALWGARRPDQLDPVRELSGWTLDENIDTEIDKILKEEIDSPVGPEFMAPPIRRLGRELV
jgi:aryl-alcohol dehydrogenase-like predicted oxidoreductase